MRAIAMFGAVLLTASPALAAPTYLVCKSGGLEWEFAVNEETNTTGLTIKASGHTENLRATFTPQTVRFVDGSGWKHTIDRVTLDHTVNVGGQDFPGGKCEIAKQAEKSKF